MEAVIGLKLAIAKGERMTTKHFKDQIIDLDDLDSSFPKEVIQRSGVNLNTCLHCLSCAGGCEFSNNMDFLPNQMIRMVQLGLKNKALSCSGIWFCVGCNTCSIQCPMGIDISTITDVLCQIALEKGIVVAEPHILKFHEEVLNSIKRYGRTHKLEIMFRYKLYKKDWFSDMGVGFKMLTKRKLDILPSKISEPEEIKKFFQKNRMDNYAGQ